MTACACYGGRLCRLTFELSGRQRQDGRARPEKMCPALQAGPCRPAVGAPLERGVRHHRRTCRSGALFLRSAESGLVAGTCFDPLPSLS